MKRSVLLIGTFLSARGGRRCVCEDIAERLEGRGWNVVCASSKEGRAARCLDMLLTAWKRRADYHVALVEVFSGPAFLWAEAVCGVLRAAGRPCVLALHGGNLPAFAHQHPLRVRVLLDGASAVIAPSAYLAGTMRPYRKDVQLIPNAIEVGRYAFRTRSPAAPRLLWLRAFHELYNPALAIRTAALVRRTHPGVRLRMVGADKGDGSWERCARLAKTLGVSGAVELSPGVPKQAVPAEMDAADILVNTASVDNTPVSVIEAMAAGLCVISTEVGGIPYLAADGEDALLVRRDDPAAMAAAVRRILDEPETAARLSNNARARALQFDWSTVLPELERTLDRAA